MALRDATMRTILALPVVTAAVLAAATGARASTCEVTVVTTDSNGNEDHDVPAFEAPCRSGESNGGIEYYNPYNDTYRYSAVSLVPLSGSTHSTSAGGSQTGSAGTTASSGCTPVARNGTKTTAQPMQTKGSVPCPAPSAGVPLR